MDQYKENKEGQQISHYTLRSLLIILIIIIVTTSIGHIIMENTCEYYRHINYYTS